MTKTFEQTRWRKLSVVRRCVWLRDGQITSGGRSLSDSLAFAK